MNTPFRNTGQSKSLIPRKMAGNGTDGERVKKTRVRQLTPRFHYRITGRFSGVPKQLLKNPQVRFKRKKPRPESRARLFETGKEALYRALMRAERRDSLRDTVFWCSTPLVTPRIISG
jgi:hypothetical protein